MFATEVWQDQYETAPEAEEQHHILAEEQEAPDGTMAKLLPAKATPQGYSLSRDDSEEILNIRMKEASQ